MRALLVVACLAAIGCGDRARGETKPVEASGTRAPSAADAEIDEPFDAEAPEFDACLPLDAEADEGLASCDAVHVGPYRIDATCGSKPDLPCDFESIVRCCGTLVENAVVVQLADGCATSIGFLADRPQNDAMASCIVAMIAGRRLDCRAGTTCLEALQSTVK